MLEDPFSPSWFGLRGFERGPITVWIADGGYLWFKKLRSPGVNEAIELTMKEGINTSECFRDSHSKLSGASAILPSPIASSSSIPFFLSQSVVQLEALSRSLTSNVLPPISYHSYCTTYLEYTSK